MLSTALDWSVFDQVLRRLGEGLHVDRTLVFQITGTPVPKQVCRFDWAAEGLTKVAGDLPQPQEDLASARSYLTAPIQIDGVWWGHLCAEDRTVDRNWTRGERQVVGAVASLLAQFVIRRGGSLLAGAAGRGPVPEAGQAIVTTDEAGLILELNTIAARLFGRAREDLLKQPLTTLLKGCAVADLKREAAQGGRLECEASNAAGAVFPVEVKAMQAGLGDRVLYTLAMRDISRLRQARRALERLAFRDGLTGLPNRVALLRDLAGAARTVRGIVTVQVLEMPVLAASLGQAFADHLLVALASRLRLLLDRPDRLARTGEAQYSILIEGDVPALELAHDIFSLMREPLILDGRSVFAQVAVGAAAATGGGTEHLLQDAEMACFAEARPGVRLFDGALRDLHRARFDIEADLREAVAAGQIDIMFQPILSLPNGGLAGFEALARWRHPVRGEVPSAEFIPIAEATGLIVPLGLQVLELAADAQARWQEPGGPGPSPRFVSVNLSGGQFIDPLLVEKIQDVLRRHRLDSSAIKLELTESILMDQTEETVETLTRLRRLGLRLSIDDFGTGYSSLSYLRHFPIDCLKIDRGFVTNVAKSREDREIVRAVVDLGRALGHAVLAEGIETEEDFAVIRGLGCDYVQGYLVGRPMSFAEATARIAAEPPARIGTA